MVRGEYGDHDDQCHGRQDPAASSSVEVKQSRCPDGGPLSEQEPGNDEARKYEEDVHTHEPASQSRYSRMVQNDEKDGDGSQTLYVRPELSISRRCAGLVPRLEESAFILLGCHHLSATGSEQMRSSDEGTLIACRRPVGFDLSLIDPLRV